MTALERALVVYAEAKGYGIEVEYRLGFWKNKQYEGKFDFGQCEYRIKNREDYRKVYDELSDFFKPITPEHDRTWKIEDLIKYDAPEGFFCKSVLTTQKEIEEMNKPKRSPFETDSPEVRERYAKVRPFIMLMEAWAEGEEIEFRAKPRKYDEVEPWSKYPSSNKMPEWNFSLVDYREAPKQPEAIPATEGELEYIKELVFDLLEKHIPLKTNSEIEIQVRKEKATNMVDISIGKDCFLETWYIFDPVSKTWQDWSSK